MRASAATVYANQGEVKKRSEHEGQARGQKVSEKTTKGKRAGFRVWSPLDG
jgi:hypothetical protein